MTRAELLAFMRTQRYAVEASYSPNSGPQAATVGVVVNDAFELVFDTLAETRKALNLLLDPRVAFVFGSLDDGTALTVQYEGIAERLSGPGRAALVESYLRIFPDGRDRQALPGLVYYHVRPTWLRFSDFSTVPSAQIDFTQDELLALR